MAMIHERQNIKNSIRNSTQIGPHIHWPAPLFMYKEVTSQCKHLHVDFAMLFEGSDHVSIAPFVFPV